MVLSGAIYAPEAYAKAKMLDHSGWTMLPRQIKPSDIDAVVDNNGHFLFMEFCSYTHRWDKLKTGQRLLHENLVHTGGGKITSVLVYHKTEPDKQIDTIRDVVAFTVMGLKDGRLERHSARGSAWIPFIQWWWDK